MEQLWDCIGDSHTWRQRETSKQNLWYGLLLVSFDFSAWLESWNSLWAMSCSLLEKFRLLGWAQRWEQQIRKNGIDCYFSFREISVETFNKRSFISQDEWEECLQCSVCALESFEGLQVCMILLGSFLFLAVWTLWYSHQWPRKDLHHHHRFPSHRVFGTELALRIHWVFLGNLIVIHNFPRTETLISWSFNEAAVTATVTYY